MNQGFFTTIACAALIGLAGYARAEVIQLTGFGASTSAPLAATVDIAITDPTSLVMTLTNNASLGGADNRITYFGFQMPTADFTVRIDPTSDSRWTVDNNAHLPGRGANTFNWLIQEDERGGAAGLNIGESLILNVHADQPLFDPLDITGWTPTSKNGYLFAAKFQSVGLDANDSGVAFKTTPPPSSPPGGQVAVPEPATILLAGLGLCMIFGARPKRLRR